MKLTRAVREAFRRYGRDGGRKRARRLNPARRRAVARRAAMCRWIRFRFGDASFEALGLPGGALIDKGLADLAAERVTPESLLVSIAAPRLRREGIPIGVVIANPNDRLYDLFAMRDGDLAHARYSAHLRQVTSFADACHLIRPKRRRRAS